jgi:hypothetical protein
VGPGVTEHSNAAIAERLKSGHAGNVSECARLREIVGEVTRTADECQVAGANGAHGQRGRHVRMPDPRGANQQGAVVRRDDGADRRSALRENASYGRKLEGYYWKKLVQYYGKKLIQVYRHNRAARAGAPS